MINILCPFESYIMCIILLLIDYLDLLGFNHHSVSSNNLIKFISIINNKLTSNELNSIKTKCEKECEDYHELNFLKVVDFIKINRKYFMNILSFRDKCYKLLNSRTIEEINFRNNKITYVKTYHNALNEYPNEGCFVYVFNMMRYHCNPYKYDFNNADNKITIRDIISETAKLLNHVYPKEKREKSVKKKRNHTYTTVSITKYYDTLHLYSTVSDSFNYETIKNYSNSKKLTSDSI